MEWEGLFSGAYGSLLFMAPMDSLSAHAHAFGSSCRLQEGMRAEGRTAAPAVLHGLPAESMLPGAKRAKVGPSASAVAFILCTEHAQNFSSRDDLVALLKAVRHALDAGAKIVNIACSRITREHRVDWDTILRELKEEFDAKWISSVGQPAYSFRKAGAVISFFSTACGTLLSEDVLDPENCSQSLMLTFDTPEGVVCIINTSVPRLPSRAAARILNAYSHAAVGTKADCITIGGTWQTTSLVMQNLVQQLDLDFELFSNGRLCLLACTPEKYAMQCSALGNDLTQIRLVLYGLTPQR